MEGIGIMQKPNILEYVLTHFRWISCSNCDKFIAFQPLDEETLENEEYFCKFQCASGTPLQEGLTFIENENDPYQHEGPSGFPPEYADAETSETLFTETPSPPPASSVFENDFEGQPITYGITPQFVQPKEPKGISRGFPPAGSMEGKIGYGNPGAKIVPVPAPEDFD